MREQVVFWTVLGFLVRHPSQTVVALIALPIGGTLDWNSGARNFTSLVVALLVALDGPWWCLATSFVFMVLSAQVFISLAWCLLKGLLTIENALCCYSLELNNKSSPSVALTIRKFDQSNLCNVPERSPRDSFKVMASKI